MATVYHTPPPETPQRAAGPLKLAGQFTLGVLFLVSVLLLGWGVFDYLTSRFVSLDAKRVEERKKILADRQTEDHKLLHDAPSWFAKDKGMVRVPIDQAMKLTVAKLQADKPRAAYPIAAPATDSGAPTSPDKGAGSVPGQNTNPPASNPTTGHPVPTPAPSPTPALPAAGSNGAPVAPSPTPAQSAAPAASAAPAHAAAPTPTPTPTATAAPTAAQTPANNANNPGSAPIPGAQPQPQPAPVDAAAASATPPHTGPAPLATPPSQPTPAGTPAAGTGPAPTATPGPNVPGANPGATP